MTHHDIIDFFGDEMLEDYLNSVKERDSQGIPPLPLDAEQTSGLIELIKDASKNDKNLLSF